jgi:hypothetical protein
VQYRVRAGPGELGVDLGGVQQLEIDGRDGDFEAVAHGDGRRHALDRLAHEAVATGDEESFQGKAGAGENKMLASAACPIPLAWVPGIPFQPLLEDRKMTRNRLGLTRLLLLAAVPLLAAGLAQAQATRTWVSGVGDDANPCSRTAPCKTYAGAISKTAAGGEISTLDPGGFGAVTITKAITINGDGTLGGILAAGTTGVTVNAGANDVVILRNLSIAGAGSGLRGIWFRSGSELHVENVTIYGFLGQGILFQPSVPAALFASRVSIQNSFDAGILVQPTPAGAALATLQDVRMDGNGHGLMVEEGSSVIVRNSQAGGNVVNGFAVTGGTRPAFLVVEGGMAVGNTTGVLSSGGNASARLSGATVSRNATGLQSASGGAIISFGNNRVSGNNLLDGNPTLLEAQK